MIYLSDHAILLEEILKLAHSGRSAADRKAIEEIVEALNYEDKSAVLLDYPIDLASQFNVVHDGNILFTGLTRLDAVAYRKRYFDDWLRSNPAAMPPLWTEWCRGYLIMRVGQDDVPREVE